MRTILISYIFSICERDNYMETSQLPMIKYGKLKHLQILYMQNKSFFFLFLINNKRKSYTREKPYYIHL